MSIQKSKCFITLLLIGILIISGCSNDNQQKSEEAKTTTKNEESVKVSAESVNTEVVSIVESHSVLNNEIKDNFIELIDLATMIKNKETSLDSNYTNQKFDEIFAQLKSLIKIYNQDVSTNLINSDANSKYREYIQLVIDSADSFSIAIKTNNRDEFNIVTKVKLNDAVEKYREWAIAEGLPVK